MTTAKTGDAQQDTLTGAQGDDTIAGATGNDTVTGAAPGDVDPRESVMEQIAAGNRDRMARELEEHNRANGIVTTPVTPPAAEKPADQVDDQLNTQLGDAEVMEDAALEKVKVKVVIDGEERVVTGLDMKREFQMGTTAAIRLQEASRLLKEVKATAAAPVATPAPPVGDDGAAAPGNSPVAPKPDPGMETTGKEFLSSLFEGDETKAMEALTKLLGGRATGPTQTEGELIAKLTPAVKQQLEQESALDKFVVDFKDVVTDPYLASMADQHLAAIVKAEPDKPYAEALALAGTKTRDWLASKGVKPAASPAPTASPRAEKLERKAAADSVAGLNARASLNEPAVPSNSQVIAEMAAARNLGP